MACRLTDSVFLFKGPQQRMIGQIISTQNSPGICYLKWESALQKGVRSKRCSFSTKRVRVVQAVATPVAPSPADSPDTEDTAEYRKQLCERYGFKQIGELLPDNVTLKDIISSLPKKYGKQSLKLPFLLELSAYPKEHEDTGYLIVISFYVEALRHCLQLPKEKSSIGYSFSILWRALLGLTIEDLNFEEVKVFAIDDVKAWKSVLISVTSYSLGLLMIAKSPWYLLPLAWAWTGTAVTGFFVIGHDCAHKSFTKNKLLEDIVGTLAFLPLIYPYEPWRFKHDQHHAKTNMLNEDTAWHPIRKEEIDASSAWRKAMMFAYGPIRPWMSIGHWLAWHFNLDKFRPNEVKRVKISLACVFAFMAISWPLIIYKAGIVGWIKFWLMPWLGYHFWMSTFTMVHHTAPHIPFKSSDEWNGAQAQLNGTVHCDYPNWIEILCHDINVHIPHHISPRIPSYNLRAAHKSIQDNWGKYLNEATWNWRLMKTIMTVCHVYNKEHNYVALDELYEDSKPITFLKQVMPDYA